MRAAIRRLGVPLRAVNIWEDDDGAAFVRSVAGGNETVPTVVVGGRALVNPSSSQLRALLAAEAPQLLAEAPGRGAGRLGRLFRRPSRRLGA